jgi:hypothetical protein
MAEDDKKHMKTEIMTPSNVDDDEWEALDICTLQHEEAAVPSSLQQGVPIVSESDLRAGNQATLCRRRGGTSTMHRPLPRNEATAITRRHSAQQPRRSDSSRSNSNTRSRSAIVDHPMQHIASHFLIHLCREVWALDWAMRMALACCFTGGMFQLIEWCFWYALYPEKLLWTITFLLGAGIPAFYYYKPRIEVALRDLQSSSSNLDAADVLGRCLDSTQLRAFAAIWFVVVPAVLELRTLHFLTTIVGGSITAAILFLLGLFGCCGLEWKKQNDNGPNYWNSHRPSPRKCTQTGLYLLYGSALLVILNHGTDKRHIPSLAARFFPATAILLWKSATTSDPSQAVRAALRYTVRDALQEVGMSVQQDELLQLAMLRWIVDYWSSTSQATNSSSSSPPTPTNSTSSQLASPHSQVERPHQELEWTELWAMLQTTTDQMATEVETLQQHSPQEQGQGGIDSFTTRNATTSPQRPFLEPNASHEPSTFAQGFSTSSGNPRNGNSVPTAHDQQFGDSVQNLQTMLASMDLDERAKPAVRAYRRAVEAFPPSRRTAIALGVTRRCPAILLLCFYVVFGLLGLYRSSFTTMVILLPFSLFEVLRIRLWVDACRLESDDSRNRLLESVDSMTILLMDENYYLTSHLPTLLVVWQNVCTSVSTLEVSLTAARCVQTTAVAVDFAANVMSLANFGYEVSQHGWLHGLSILAKELLHLHTTGTDLSTLSHGISTPAGATYTSAAVSAVRNSQTISRNFRVLSEEEDASKVIGPALGFLALLIGQGWLWGRDQDEPVQTTQRESRSSVEIVELDDEGEAVHSSGRLVLENSCALEAEPDKQLLLAFRESIVSVSRVGALTELGTGTQLLSNADEEDPGLASLRGVAEAKSDESLESTALPPLNGDKRVQIPFQSAFVDDKPREKQSGLAGENDVPNGVDVHTSPSVSPSKDDVYEENPPTNALSQPDSKAEAMIPGLTARCSEDAASPSTIVHPCIVLSTLPDTHMPVRESSFESVSANAATLDPKPGRNHGSEGVVSAIESKNADNGSSPPITVEVSASTLVDFEAESSEMMDLLAQCDEHGLLDVVSLVF